MRVKLHHVTTKNMLTALRNDEVEFGVGSMLDLPDDIYYRAVYSYGLSLIVPKGHPLASKPEITLEDIASDDLILPPRHLTTWRLVNLVFQQHSIPYRVRLEVGSWEIVKHYVELGFGIGIASDICLTGREDFVVRKLPDLFPERTYGVMLRRGKFLSPQAKRFIAMMQPDFFDRLDEFTARRVRRTVAGSSPAARRASNEVWMPHATVAAVVERDGAFLLVEETKDGRRVLNQPAGHLEDGESLLEAVVRETLEETGWTFRPRAWSGSTAGGTRAAARRSCAPASIGDAATAPSRAAAGCRHRSRRLADPRRDPSRRRTGCAARWCCARSRIT